MEKQDRMEKKVFAFDLDGTLTEHRTWITDEHLAMLDALKERGIHILIVGAGRVRRIAAQMRGYDVDIIGNYGLQYARYDKESGDLVFIRDMALPCDGEAVRKTVAELREKLSFTAYTGDSEEVHPSGCVTVPLLGTKADIADKMLFDQDRSRRRAVYDTVAAAFPAYSVFIGGSTSFDMVPMPYNKYYALDLYAQEEGYSHAEITYFGDDYGCGGNDEPVYKSDIDFVKVDKSSALEKIMEDYLASL